MESRGSQLQFLHQIKRQDERKLMEVANGRNEIYHI